jgi:hypothetical protein
MNEAGQVPGENARIGSLSDATIGWIAGPGRAGPLPAGQHRGPDGQRRLAGCHLQPQDSAGNRRTPPGLVPRSPRWRHNGGVEIPDHSDALPRQGGLGAAMQMPGEEPG